MDVYIYIYGQSVQSSKWGRFIPRLFLDFCLRCWSRMAMPLEGHTLFCCCASLPLDAQTRSCCTQTLLECDDYFQRLHLAPPWSIPTDLEDLRCWHSAFLWYYYYTVFCDDLWIDAAYLDRSSSPAMWHPLTSMNLPFHLGSDVRCPAFWVLPVYRPKTAVARSFTCGGRHALSRWSR